MIDNSELSSQELAVLAAVGAEKFLDAVGFKRQDVRRIDIDIQNMRVEFIVLWRDPDGKPVLIADEYGTMRSRTRAVVWPLGRLSQGEANG